MGNGMKRNFFLKEYSFHSLVGEFNRREWNGTPAPILSLLSPFFNHSKIWILSFFLFNSIIHFLSNIHTRERLKFIPFYSIHSIKFLFNLLNMVLMGFIKITMLRILNSYCYVLWYIVIRFSKKVIRIKKCTMLIDI